LKTFPITRKFEHNAEFVLDAAVGNALVVGIKAARHLAQRCRIERNHGRRRFAAQLRRKGHNRFGRSRIVIAYIVDAPGMGPCHRRLDHACDVIDMDARKHLPWFGDPPGGSGREIDECVAPGPVDSREAEHVDRQRQPQPRRFGHHTARTALAGRLERARLVDPTAVAVAVHSGGREIPRPAPLAGACGKVAGMSDQHGIARGIGRDRTQQMAGALQRGMRIDQRKDVRGNSLARKKSELRVIAHRTGHTPALCKKTARQHKCAVAEAEAEQVPVRCLIGHGPRHVRIRPAGQAFRPMISNGP